MFSSAPPRRGGSVMWLEPGRGRRRRRPAGPRPGAILAALLVLVVVGGAAYLFFRQRHRTEERKAVVTRYVDAYAKGDDRAMWETLDTASQRRYPLARFRTLQNAARARASVTSVRAGAVPGPSDGVAAVPVAVRTRIFGTLRGTIPVAVHDEADGAAIAWTPDLRLPGLRKGEQIKRVTLATPVRASVIGADGRRMADTPATADIAAGLEHDWADRLAGTPGAELRFGDRVVVRVKAHRGRSVRATIRPGLQRAAAAALGNRLGGVAVIRPRDGSVLALAGLAVSAPQPPGSTFKIITTSAALQAGVARPSSSYPVRSAATLSGVTLRNAGGESCGGTLVRSFVESCNSVFAPLGARVGARKLVDMAEGFGFNEPIRVPAAKTSTISQPGKLRDSLAVGAAAIGQDRDLATPVQMASVAATIGNRGTHARLRVVRNQKVLRRRVVSRRVADEVRSMMIGVVQSGTGTAAAIPGVTVAGKTGTAELRPNSTNPKDADAWFVAFAPASKPRVAVGVMLVGAGFGGTAAAPIARRVLLAALR
jgi:penicillin-binding protein A